MSDPERGPVEPKPVPKLVWILAAMVVVAAFILAMWILNPPGAGVGRPSPGVIVPAAPKSSIETGP